ncbi:hypothetical protein B0J11DRAFT_512604 [Dendryphion nanum]|uniref:Uncharacterized protein n=1 Tax=Dendryphion nanum TaxID=256645 RepID=A0A9P9CZW7_9PLEO|nr:hypothetical protein B0J11DRAFT_512604 [Dendryphion nanum]
MAEVVIGVLASGITIADFVVKFRRLTSKLKHVDGWRRYCDGLEMLHCIQTAVKEVNRTTSNSYTFKVTIDGKSETLLEHCNSRLEHIVTIAQDVLNKIEHPQKTKRTKIKSLFWKLRDRLVYILKEEDILELIDGVEFAKSSLILALQAISLSCNATHQDSVDQQHSRTEALIQGMGENLLSELRRRGQEIDEFFDQSRRRKRVISVQLADRDPKMKQYNQAVDPECQNNKDRGILFQEDDSSAILHATGDQSTPLSTGVVQTFLEAAESRLQNEDVEPSLAMVPTQNDTLKTIHESVVEETAIQEELDLFIQDGALIIDDTEVIEPSLVDSGVDFTVHSCLPRVPLWEYLIKIDESHWERLNESNEVNAAEAIRALPTIDDDSSTGRCDYEILPREVYGFISKEVNVELCTVDCTEAIFFCIEKIDLVDDRGYSATKLQKGLNFTKSYFVLREPCSTSKNCNHATMEGFQGETFRRIIDKPFPITLKLQTQATIGNRM